LMSDVRAAVDPFVQSLETECSLKKIRLVKLQSWEAARKTKNTTTTLGFIVWYDQAMFTIQTELAATLEQYHKPVAILFHGHEKSPLEELMEYYCRKQSFFISSPDSGKNAGLLMGNFLLEKGHKKICCITDQFNMQVKATFYEGLHEAFAFAHKPGAVVPLSRSDFPKNELRLFANKKDLAFENSFKNEAVFLEKTLDEIKSKPPLSQRRWGQKLEIQTFEAKVALNQFTYYAPLFRKALAIKDATAWVCTGDDIAMYGAFEFLWNEHIKWPDQIGVAGFDNIPESRMKNLTTYQFDYAGTARKMLSLILYPEYAKKTLCIKGTNIFEIDGMVIDRGSA
jgi:hypothetical protein